MISSAHFRFITGRTNHYNDSVRLINSHFANYFKKTYVFKRLCIANIESMFQFLLYWNQFPKSSKSSSLVFTLWVDKESAVHQSTYVLTPPTISVSACIYSQSRWIHQRSELRKSTQNNTS